MKSVSLLSLYCQQQQKHKKKIVCLFLLSWLNVLCLFSLAHIVFVLHLYSSFLSTIYIFSLFISFENDRKNEQKMKHLIGKTVEFYTHTHTQLHINAFISMKTHKFEYTRTPTPTHTNTHTHSKIMHKCKGGLSKPKPIKSVIGMFRRESTTSNSVAGSDPCLAAQLAEAIASTSGNHPPSIAATSGTYRASISGVPSEHIVERIMPRGDRRRSISICAVTPIDECSEHGVDPVGALIELKSNDKYTKKDNIYCKNNRRRSLFELSG